MSKQSEEKLNQGYNEKPIPRTCANCARYESESITHKHSFGEYTQEKNKRCGLGGFAVKKTATCLKWEAKLITQPSAHPAIPLTDTLQILQSTYAHTASGRSCRLSEDTDFAKSITK